MLERCVFSTRAEVAVKTLLISMTLVILLAVAGCSQTEQSTPTAETATATTTAATSLPPSSNDNPRPLPPADNGTMPLPGQGGFNGVPALDLAAAASKLGITEQQLREALGDQTQGQMDLAAVAEKLGVSTSVLREALGISDNGTFPGTPPNGGPPPGNLTPSEQAK
jgi:hypothetical protein